MKIHPYWKEKFNAYFGIKMPSKVLSKSLSKMMKNKSLTEKEKSATITSDR